MAEESKKTVKELSEELAKAKRAYTVSMSLANEYRRKLQQAEEETNDADRYLSKISYELNDAIFEEHGDVYGDPIDDADRAAFEKRWNDRRAEIEKRRSEHARRNEKAKATEDLLIKDPFEVDPDGIKKDLMQEAKTLLAETDARVVSADVVRTNLGFSSNA